jgi:ubiquinone/menaquinone biosynthesis C-methylase UbiE
MPIKHWFYTTFPALKQPLHRRWYEYISALDKNANMLFMNHGYAVLDSDAELLALSAEDEHHRYSLQLYHHMASAIDWSGARVLEVGSGRGGGASYINRRFNPRSIVGIDITANAIDFCCRHYSTDGLFFARGDAQLLPFAGNSFDVVFNVESSGYYPDFERFLQEVIRVLRPGGHFLYADMRYQEDIETWRAQLDGTGLRLIKEEDITPNAIQALALDRERKQELIKQHVPRVFHGLFGTFAGIGGADLAHGLPKPGERIYLNWVFCKPRG